MVRKRRTEIPRTGEATGSHESSGSGGRGGPQQGGGGRGWGTPNPHQAQQPGGRGASGGGVHQPREVMPQQQPHPSEQHGRGGYQPRGGTVPQQSYRGRGGGRGGSPLYVPELYQARPSASPHPSSALAISPQSVVQATVEVSQQLQQMSVQSEETLSTTTRAIVPVAPSSKSIRFPPRPGKGNAGVKCMVKANHFFAELPNKDLHQYDVRASPSFCIFSIAFSFSSITFALIT